MSDLTPELNLALCVGDDDTADYLTQSAGLRGSLSTIDGLFSSSTGHNHNGAHQGGNFTTLSLSGDLTIGGNIQASGTLTALGAAHFPSLTVDGAVSAGSLSVSGALTTSTLHVTSTSQFDGALTVSNTLTASSVSATTLASTLDTTVGRTLTVNGSATVAANLSANVVTGNALVSNGNANVAATLTAGAVNTNGGTLTSVTLASPSVNGNLAFQANGNTITWPGGELVGAGETIGRAATVYLNPHAYVYFDLGVGHVVTCQSLVQTSDPNVKANAVVMTDDTCMTRVRGNVPVYTYQLTPPSGGDESTAPSPTPTDIGFMATDVYAASPEFAALDTGGAAVGVNYANMAAMLWGALRQLDARCTAKGI
jgi:hypothetical protein